MEPDLDALFADRRMPNEAAVESAGSLVLGIAGEAAAIGAFIFGGISGRFVDGGFGIMDGAAIAFILIVL